jgi:F-type H+-transporting ATPase subunit b
MRFGRLVALVFLSVLVLSFAAPPESAAQQHGGGGKAEPAKGAHDDHGGDSKKVEIFKGSLDLAIWTLVVFLLLLFVLSKVAWKPMLQGLRKREAAIREAIEEAKHAREETHRVRTELQAEIAKAHAEIPALMDEARRKAQEASDKMRDEAAKAIQADRQRLRRDIETARDQALQDLWNQAAQLATRISAKAIRRSLSPEDHRRLVDEALDELKQAPKKV